MEGAVEKAERMWSSERKGGSREDVSQRQKKEAAMMGKHSGR